MKATFAKKTLAILAGAALLTAPLAIPTAALAQGHGGGGHSSGGFHGGGGGGFRGGAGFHGGGGFRGGYGGFRGGYGGYRGYGGYGALGLGLGLGLGAAYAYAPYYGYGYDYGYPDVAYADPAYSYAPPPCGQWVWNPAAGRYDWVATAC